MSIYVTVIATIGCIVIIGVVIVVSTYCQHYRCCWYGLFLIFRLLLNLGTSSVAITLVLLSLLITY